MTIRVRVRQGALVVRARGHLTPEAARELHDQVLQELAPKPRDVVLNLSQIESIAAGALAWVFRIQRETDASDTRLILAGQSQAVQRLLEKTNVSGALEIVDSEQDALRGAVSSA
jgi:anti-anti-sigma factor